MKAAPASRPVVGSPAVSGRRSQARKLLFLGAATLPLALWLAVQPVTATQATKPEKPEKPTGQSFRDDFDRFDRSRWYVSDGWANGDWQNCTWSKKQLDLSDGVLTLNFGKRETKSSEKRDTKGRDYACAEIQTHKRFGYGTYEARFKTDTGTGINAAFFTYIGPTDGQPHDEIDFEVLTKDTSKVSVNTYVDGKPKNGSEVPVEGGAHTGFNHYAFVWEEGRIRWYLNGKLVHEASEPAELPTHPQKIFFSLWGSDTYDDWMGTFEDPGRELTMEVDWIAFTALGDECQFPESIACRVQ